MHFWPFDGWDIPPSRPVIAEVRLAFQSRAFPNGGRMQDQRDAFAATKWLREADREGSLQKYFEPRLEPDERKKAEIEGWILGVL